MANHNVNKKSADKAIAMLKNICQEFDCETCIIKKPLKCQGSSDCKVPIPSEWGEKA